MIASSDAIGRSWRFADDKRRALRFVGVGLPRGGEKHGAALFEVAEAVGSTASLRAAVHQVYTLAAAQGESESYVPALARALGKVNGVAIGPQD